MQLYCSCSKSSCKMRLLFTQRIESISLYVCDQDLTIFTWLFLANHAWVPTRVCFQWNTARFIAICVFYFVAAVVKNGNGDEYVRNKNNEFRFEELVIDVCSLSRYEHVHFVLNMLTNISTTIQCVRGEWIRNIPGNIWNRVISNFHLNFFHSPGWPCRSLGTN